MKKYFKFIILFFTILFIVIGLMIINKSKENKNSEKVNFSKMYKVDEKNVFEKINAKDAIDLVKNRTGIIYLGYKDCPWCQNLVPVLNDAAKENNVNTVYYIDDFYYMRPDKNDNPKHKKEYNELVKILGEDIVEMHNDENEFDIIRVPLVLFVKNGKLVDYHKGTYEGHVLKEKIDKNGKTVKYLEDLTEKQKKELKKVLTKKIKKVYEGQCTTKNGC